MSSVTFSTAVGGDGSTVTDDDNATTGLRNGGWRTRFVPCFTQQVAVATNAVASATSATASKTAAATSATTAATSATASATSATAAATSATAAATSATASATSATSASASAATIATLVRFNAAGYVEGYNGTVWQKIIVSTAPTGATILSAGTTAQRDASPVAGYMRFNSTNSSFEGYNGAVWGSIGGGATGGGQDQVFVQNSMVVTTSYAIPADKSASSVGAITINSGVAVTVPSGSRWVIL